MRISLRHVGCTAESCPLYGRLDLVPAELLRDHDYDRLDCLFVGEAPGRTEVQKGRPFIGQSGQLLRRAIKRAKVADVNIGFSNVIRCLPLDGSNEIRRPAAEEVECCQHFLLRDIEQTDPDVLILLGQTALNLLLPDRPAIHTERGRWRRLTIAGRERLVCTTWHPAFVGRQKSALPGFYNDLKLYLRMAAGWRPQAKYGALGTSHCLKSVSEVRRLVETLQSLPSDAYVAVDVETRNLNKRYGNRLGMVQFCWDGVGAHCVPLDHPQTPFGPRELAEVRGLLRGLFEGRVSFRAWLTHFGKFEQTQIGEHVLDRGDGVARTFDNAPMLDTGGFAYLLDENAVTTKGAYSLKHLARQYLDFQHYDDATLMARSEGNLLRLPLTCSVAPGERGWEPNLTDYGGMDAIVTWRLFWALCDEAAVQRYRRKALRLLEHLFGPTFRLLSVIERNGFWGNLSHLKMLQDPERSPIVSRLLEIDGKELRAIETARRANDRLVERAAGGNAPLFDTPWVLDLNKNDHVRTWLVDVMGLEPLSVGKSGAPSVGKAFFQHYGDRPEVGLVEERRGLAKLRSAYIKQLIEYIDPRYRREDSKDGRVRCDLFFTSTVSGRGSASNPNMQQQVRGDSPAKAAIKDIWQAEQPGVQQSFAIDFAKGPPDLSAVEARPTRCLVQLDFKSNESRWWCILSGCPDLAKVFNTGKAASDDYRRNPTEKNRSAAELAGDIHKQVAAMMFDTPIEQVDKVMRTGAKAINFGMVYGRGCNSIAAQIKKTPEEAQELMDRFAARFPVGWRWLQGCPEVARERWQIESPLGRRRRLIGYLYYHANRLEMTHDERKIVSECDRMAKNSPIQGAASDASFLSACLFSKHIEQHNLSWKLQNVVHDSCVFEVPIAELRQAVDVAERCFTTDVMQVISDVWDVRWNCPLEIDFEFGLTWGALQKWDFTDAEFDRIVETMGR